MALGKPGHSREESMPPILSKNSFPTSQTTTLAHWKVKQIRLSSLSEGGPGPGSYNAQKPSIDQLVEDVSRHNELVARKGKIHKMLKSKLSMIAKQMLSKG